MQVFKTNITELVANLENNQNTTYQTFAKEQTQREFVKQLSIQSFYESYKVLFYTALVFGLVAQLASAISSYTYFAELLQNKITSPYLLIGAIVFILVAIEVIKYTVVNKAFKELFALQPSKNLPLWLVAMVVSSLSIYASIVGGGNLGIDTQQPQTLSTTFDTQIATLKQDIQGITHRNTWKGAVYLPTKEKNLVYAKEHEISNLKTAKQKALEQTAKENEINTYQFRIGFAAFELLFFGCALFSWYYKRRVSIEYLATATPQTVAPSLTENNQPAKQENHTIPNSTSNRIGFVFGKQVTNKEQLNNLSPYIECLNTKPPLDVECRTLNVENKRKCLHCNKEFTYKHWNKKYCNEVCRIESWELKTGKPFTKKKR